MVQTRDSFQSKEITALKLGKALSLAKDPKDGKALASTGGLALDLSKLEGKQHLGHDETPRSQVSRG